MDDDSEHRRAIELLQNLGLKQYEAKCFVALSRSNESTAKEISELSDVPRTRVYDAVRVLEAKGLVETQHKNPQVFRAVPTDEAVETLRTEYETRAESLRDTLRGLDPAPEEAASDVTHEVWALSGDAGIASRAGELIQGADEEVLFIAGIESIVDDRLIDALRTASARGVAVTVGTLSEPLRDRLREDLPDAEVFVSGLGWLAHSEPDGHETEISRLLLVDGEAILVSSFTEGTGAGRQNENAVFGRGFDNGLVAIVRRLMASGVLFERPGEA